ncbi:MAG: AmmeMemoRadiSam system protein B [Nitrososphaerota archaeon]|nr:AmmeMemoRadiSam system protein B [Nitrososphaerota archaeon]
MRNACVSGSFYSGSPQSLRRQIEECFKHEFGPGSIPTVNKDGPRRIVGLMSPHAGYMYSGPVAAYAYHRLALDGLIEVAVILGPNHTGLGSGVAMMEEGVWRTPLGDVEIDTGLARQIRRVCGIIDIDESSHIYEHSIEVQLPFLQYLYGSSFKIVPICFMMQDLETCRDVGESLAESLNDRNAVVIASTDLTHYEPQRVAYGKDMKALNAALKLDEELFYSIIQENRVSACGYGPVTAMIRSVKRMGAGKAELLAYKTSGDITGDTSAVVGYASMVFER